MYNCLMKLRKLSYEKAYVFDKDNNLIIEIKSNLNPDIIHFTETQNIYIYKFGYTLVHNHPTEDIPFSIQDIAYFIKSNIFCGIVISKNHIYKVILNNLTFIDFMKGLDLIAKRNNIIFMNTHENYIELSNLLSGFKYSRLSL